MFRLRLRNVLIPVFLAGLTLSVHGFTISVAPAGSVPLGNSGDYFSYGAGVNLTAGINSGQKGTLGMEGGADFLMLPLKTSDSVMIMAGTAGPSIRIPLGSFISFKMYAAGGYYYWMPNGWDAGSSEGGSWAVKGGINANFNFSKSFSILIGAGYDYYNDLYNGIRASIGTVLSLGKTSGSPVKIKNEQDKPKPQLLKNTKKNSGVEITDFELKPVFPVLFKFYDNNPIGTAVIRNGMSKQINDVKVTFYVERYMDNPMDVGAPKTIDAGAEAKIDLYGLFTEDVLAITEGTKASAKVNINYTIDGSSYTEEYNPIIEFYNRNALTWDDDRKVCAFVTAKDPVILSFAKKTTNWMKKYKNPAIDDNLQKAMVLFEAVKEYGIEYEIDPSTPFSDFSQNKLSVDFLQFPRQTLNYTNGDCDDLSVLFNSLLEATGVETAFITIPGHIYVAFALKSGPEEARKSFSAPDTLIYDENKVWVPVEITMFQDSFLKAWQQGAKEWRENESKKQANLYPTREGWKIYKAVGYNDEVTKIQLPDKTNVVNNFNKTVRRYVDREIYPQVSRIKGLINKYGDKPKYENKLAVLYARYGLYEKASKILLQIVENDDYVPAYTNLGNIAFTQKDYEKALEYYTKAYNINPNSKFVLLGMARANHELENYGVVKKRYNELKTLAPNIAARFAYLDLRGSEAARAADISGTKGMILWDDEEEE